MQVCILNTEPVPVNLLERYRREEFEAFSQELQRRYVFQEVFRYWEEAQEPLYLFGERLQPLWEIRERTPSKS